MNICSPSLMSVKSSIMHYKSPDCLKQVELNKFRK